MRIITAFIFFTSISLAGNISLTLSSQYDPCSNAPSNGDIFCGLTGQITKLQNDNLVIPMRGSVLTSGVNGEFINHFNGDGANPWFVGKATIMPNGDFMIGSWDGSMRVANANGELIKSLSFNRRSFWSTPKVLTNGNIAISSRDRSYKKIGDMSRGDVYIISPAYEVIKHYTVETEGDFGFNSVVELPNGNLAITSDFFLHIINIKNDKIKNIQIVKDTDDDDLTLETDPVVLNSGNLVIGSKESVHLLNQNGEILAQKDVHGFVLRNPLELNNHNIVLPTNTGRVYFFDSNLNLVSEHNLEVQGVASDPTQLSNGMVILGAGFKPQDGKIVFFNNKGELLETFITDLGYYYQKPIELSKNKLLLVSTNQGEELISTFDFSIEKLEK